MDPFTKHSGLVAPLDRVDVDTDQIIPKQFLKSIARTGFEQGLFFDWRVRPDGSLNPDFVLNKPVYQGEHPGIGQELRLRIVAGTRAVGASAVRVSRGHCAELCRYFSQ